MRVIIYLVFLLLAHTAFPQKTFVEAYKLNGVLPLDQSGQISYEAIRDVEHTNQTELYKRARKWFVKTYNSANSVLQINDSQTGELTGKGLLPVSVKIIRVNLSGLFWHTLIVEIKDDRYRVTLTNLSMEKHPGPLQTYKLPYIGTTQDQYTTFYRVVDEQCRALIFSLEKAMMTSNDF